MIATIALAVLATMPDTISAQTTTISTVDDGLSTETMTTDETETMVMEEETTPMEETETGDPVGVEPEESMEMEEETTTTEEMETGDPVEMEPEAPVEMETLVTETATASRPVEPEALETETLVTETATASRPVEPEAMEMETLVTETATASRPVEPEAMEMETLVTETTTASPVEPAPEEPVMEPEETVQEEIPDGLVSPGEPPDEEVPDSPPSTLQLGESDVWNGLQATFKSVQFVESYEYPSPFGAPPLKAFPPQYVRGGWVIADVELTNVSSRDITDRFLNREFYSGFSVTHPQEVVEEYGLDSNIEYRILNSEKFLGAGSIPESITLGPGDTVAGKLQFPVEYDAFGIEIHRSRGYSGASKWQLPSDPASEGFEFDDETYYDYYEYNSSPRVDLVSARPPTIPLEIGQTAVSNGFQFQLIEYGLHPSFTSSDANHFQGYIRTPQEEGMAFLIVKLDMVNNTEGYRTIDPQSFLAVWDQSNSVYRPYSTSERSGLNKDYFWPGERDAGYMFFEVPRDIESVQLLWHAGGDPTGGPQLASWTLTIQDDEFENLPLLDKWSEVGEVLSDGAIEYAVTSVDIAASVPAEGLVAEEGRKFLVADFEFTNTSENAVRYDCETPWINPRSQRAGYQVAESWNREQWEFCPLIMLPGEMIEGQVFYDVPEVADEFLLTLAPIKTHEFIIWAWAVDGMPDPPWLGPSPY